MSCLPGNRGQGMTSPGEKRFSVRASIRLGSIRGIEIGIHYSWFFIAILISWSLAEGFFPRFFENWSEVQYWTAGIVSALLLFASVLVHELAHSFVAQWKGIPVKSITLFLFGGVSNITGRADRASTEFLVAAVGPLTSAVLGVVFLLLWLVVGPDEVSDASPVQGVLLYLANINLLLAAFNLVPGFPLDGGRVLRSTVWGVTGDEQKATKVATWSGQVVGWLMIGYGLFLFLSTGELLGGLWLAFIGWFLQGAASSSQMEYEMDKLLGNVEVRQIMEPNPETVTPDLDVNSLLHEHFIQKGKRAMPVMEDDRLIGIVTMTDTQRLGQEDLQRLRVRDIMTTGELATARASDPVDNALRQMVERDVNQVIVGTDGHVEGMLSRETIVRYFHMLRDRR